MTAEYTRYALRLDPAAALSDGPSGGRDDAAQAAQVGAARVAAAVADADDDWSGAAAYAKRPDPEALHYAHPEAVDLILSLQPAGWQEDDDGHTLVFWLAEGDEAEPAAVAVLSRLGALGALEVSRELPGWEDAWRRFHTPHTVGRVHIRPPWYPAVEGALDVVVEAGLAFGTGGHATTRQCIEEIQQVGPGPLLDLGCGSGVVSFAALRLGFAPVWGIDVDAVAVHAAAGNAARNGLSPVFLLGDATDPGYPLPAAPTVVANIALRPILRLGKRVAAGDLAPDDLLLAGLLLEHGDEAASAFPAYEVVRRREEDRWLMLHLRRRP